MRDLPVLDNHIHLDPNEGRGLEAVDDFVRAGGTHLLVVNKPSWQLGALPDSRADFEVGFEATIDLVAAADDRLPGAAYPVLGVHPALINRLVDAGRTPAAARAIMERGLDAAAAAVAADRALALKSGRPHYEVSSAVWDASNAVMKYAFERAAELDCAVQLHTEAAADLTAITDWAAERGLDRDAVVKHYAAAAIQGPIPSVISRRKPLERVVEADRPFLMETDYLDDPDRPGAVLGPKLVPRRVDWLLESGHEAAVRRAHVETPRRVYGIDPVATLDA